LDEHSRLKLHASPFLLNLLATFDVLRHWWCARNSFLVFPSLCKDGGQPLLSVLIFDSLDKGKVSLLISSLLSLGRWTCLTGEPQRSRSWLSSEGEVRISYLDLALWGRSEFNWRTIVFDLDVPSQEGDSLRNHTIPNLGVSNPSERFLTDLVLAHGAREDLPVEPYYSTLEFPRKREARWGTILFPTLVFLTQVNGS